MNSAEYLIERIFDILDNYEVLKPELTLEMFREILIKDVEYQLQLIKE